MFIFVTTEKSSPRLESLALGLVLSRAVFQMSLAGIMCKTRLLLSLSLTTLGRLPLRDVLIVRPPVLTFPLIRSLLSRIDLAISRSTTDVSRLSHSYIQQSLLLSAIFQGKTDGAICILEVLTP